MSRVVPSQVVTLIDKMFPVVTQEKEDWHLTPGHANHLAAIIDMVDQIPQECLILDESRTSGHSADS